jgi:photosynthetic reaction center H subunit
MGDIVGTIDLTQVVLYVFWVGFAWLILYLIYENHREGYPMVTDDGRPTDAGSMWVPSPKTYLLPHGGSIQVPALDRADNRPINAVPVNAWAGAPLTPVGDPMLAGVGPGAWAERADSPDLTFEGEAKIVPLRIATDFFLAPEDPDPRGMTVLGAEGGVAGIVKDVWVDRSEFIIRFYEIAVGGVGATDGRAVLLPFNFGVLDGNRRTVSVSAIYSDQFAGVPVVRTTDVITFLEEEKIMAYYGAGLLYADRQRQESLL